MELAAELQRALDGVCATGAPEVRENGEWLAALDGVQYEVRAQGDAALLHLWSAQQSLVRRVVRVAEESRERVVVEVVRFGHSRHAQLEFVAAGAGREARRVDREQFCDRLRQILTDRFPDETVDSLVTSADLHHSISGSYTRGLIHRGSEAFAVLGASPNEDGVDHRRHPDVRADLARPRKRSRASAIRFGDCVCSCRAAAPPLRRTV